MQHVGRSVNKDAGPFSELFRIHHNSTERGGTEGSAIAVIRSRSSLCFSSPIAPPVCHCYVVLTLHLCSFVQFLILPATNAFFLWIWGLGPALRPREQTVFIMMKSNRGWRIMIDQVSFMAPSCEFNVTIADVFWSCMHFINIFCSY